jgi:hypothetical protein
MEGERRPDNRIRWRVKGTHPLGGEVVVQIGIDRDRVVTVVPAPGEGVYYTAKQARQAGAAYAAASQIIDAAENPPP